MGIISDVKCSRCDRQYSGLRGRCPYCGARRNKRGKHAEENTDNSKAKLIIGGLLILVLIVAVIVLIATSVSDENRTDDGNDNQQGDQNQPGLNSNDGVTSIPGVNNNTNTQNPTTPTNPSTPTTDTQTTPTNPSTPTTPTTPTENTKVQSIVITWLDEEKVDVTFEEIGDELDFDVKITPEDADVEVVWSSSDEDVVVVLQTGVATAVGEGVATLKATAGNVTAECIVRVS